MEQNNILFQKDGKNFLQLDCENAKEPAPEKFPFPPDTAPDGIVTGRTQDEICATMSVD